MLPKLKTEHLFLTSYSRMRVDLAAQVMFVYNTCVLMVPFINKCITIRFQVLSSSVAAALEYYKDESTTKTMRFVRIFETHYDIRVPVMK